MPRVPGVCFRPLCCYGFAVVMGCLLVSCGRRKSEVVWTQDIGTIGSQSSPRAADLDGDGVLDLVMGAGKNEFQKSDHGIIALNGKTGKLLWKQTATDQVYGAATFCDINADGTPDIFIGGRSPHLKALDGKTGSMLWEYHVADHAQDSILKYARFNFNNSVLVPDQNGDGIKDLLTVNGGNAAAAPDSENDRYPGVLMLFDSKTGNVLAADTMPDGKESYMSPLCFSQPGSNDLTLIFGTGGETINGHLYAGHLQDLLQHRLANATPIATETDHGFIAPPSIADINADGYRDIVAITHGSTIVAIDGKTLQPLWTQSVKGTECSNSFAVGYFTDDEVPDFFTFVSRGQWPNSAGSRQVLIDGKTGAIAYTDSIGCTGFSSPVVYDLNRDGRDEVIISVNEFDCALGFAGKTPPVMENKLIAIDFSKSAVQVIDQTKGFKNIFSTPWIGDLDGDGYLDIVHCQYYHHGDLLLFLGTRIKRIATPIRVKTPVRWGAYMGTFGDGIFDGDHITP